MVYGWGLGRRVGVGSLTIAPSAFVGSLQNFPKNTKMWGQLGWGYIYQDYCRAKADKLKLFGGLS